MIIYSVQITINLEILDAWIPYMRDEHIKDMINTGCFSDAKMFQSNEKPNEFRVDYYADSISDLQKYLSDFADDLRDDHHFRFPKGVQFSRNVWESIE